LASFLHGYILVKKNKHKLCYYFIGACADYSGCSGIFAGEVSMAVYIADWHNLLRYANDSPYSDMRTWEYHPQ